MTMKDSLYDLAAVGNEKALSVIGLAKNVGKTTTLNYLMSEASKRPGTRLGISSTGWDGEAFDSITGMPKPRIIVPRGAVIATTEHCLPRSPLPHRVISRTGMHTSLGDVVLIEALEEGRVEVAGPVTVSELIEVKEMMLREGCSLLLFDGAINRKASSSPEVCGGAIVATGLNAGYHIDDVKRTTSFWVELYSLPQWDGPLPPEDRDFLFLDERGEEAYRMTSGSFTAEGGGTKPPGRTACIAAPGAFTDTLAGSMIPWSSLPPVVIRDTTALFLTPAMLGRFKKRGGRIFLRRKTQVMAFTVNPTAASGRKWDAGEFLELMAEVCAPYHVWDVVSGKGMISCNERKAQP
ncbi:MAG: hypothetical protein RDV48_23240 [Candidatus Eremiobacteraeota bacterium]|nr:hypothetical protein [Candidatus Eremiobacteraeota bacterium]